MVRRRRGIRGHGWLCGGGNRRELTWWGQGSWRRRQRRRTRVGWRSKGGGLKCKTPGYGATVTGTKQIGAEYSVSLASVQGVEHHRPNMHMPSGHGDRLRRRRRYVICCISEICVVVLHTSFDYRD